MRQPTKLVSVGKCSLKTTRVDGGKGKNSLGPGSLPFRRVYFCMWLCLYVCVFVLVRVCVRASAGECSCLCEYVHTMVDLCVSATKCMCMYTCQYLWV